ncbi:MAG: hypothetical protein ACI4QT_05670 [Kiritimatiellia bacterium]
MQTDQVISHRARSTGGVFAFFSRLMFAAAVLLFAGKLYAVTVSENALLLEMSSDGPDCYADGNPAVDGEYYALVAVANGVTFAGFAADGTLVDGVNSRILAKLPLAKGGCCPKTSVAVDEGSINSGERLVLVLLDTRATIRSGADFRVDGWAEISSSPAIATYGFRSLAGSSNTDMVQSAVPEDTPRPRILGVRLEGDEMVLTVADTINVLDYNLEAGVTPTRLNVSGAALEPVAGNPQHTIELRVRLDVDSDCGFFRVVRDGGAQ